MMLCCALEAATETSASAPHSSTMRARFCRSRRRKRISTPATAESFIGSPERRFWPDPKLPSITHGCPHGIGRGSAALSEKIHGWPYNTNRHGMASPLARLLNYALSTRASNASRLAIRVPRPPSARAHRSADWSRAYFAKNPTRGRVRFRGLAAGTHQVDLDRHVRLTL